jgi:hypothetical protein
MTCNVADAHGFEQIHFNQLNVGWTLTPNEFAFKVREGLPQDWSSELPKAFAPSGRLFSAEDVAWFAVFFPFLMRQR